MIIDLERHAKIKSILNKKFEVDDALENISFHALVNLGYLPLDIKHPCAEISLFTPEYFRKAIKRRFFFHVVKDSDHE